MNDNGFTTYKTDKFISKKWFVSCILLQKLTIKNKKEQINVFLAA